MQCPKCDSSMELVKYDKAEVDRCSHCGGMWFDLGETGKLDAEAAARIDTGDPRVGHVYNEESSYRCPRCQGGMIKMVDHRQPHIWYEQCSACFGVFLDAGELSDMKHESILDAIKDLLTPERR